MTTRDLERLATVAEDVEPGGLDPLTTLAMVGERTRELVGRLKSIGRRLTVEVVEVAS